MAKVTMELIKELREKTHVGMMDCKKALIEADGDIEKAIEILRKKGASVAAKRAGNETTNGNVAAYVTDNHKVGALVEISCETDFSANTQDMLDFAALASKVLATKKECDGGTCNTECLLGQTIPETSKTFSMFLDELIAKISENIKLSRCSRFDAGDNGFVNAYIHPGANIGTMIELEVEGLGVSNKEAIKQLSKDLCMQIAAANPICVDSTKLDTETLEKEKRILKEQLIKGGKPEAMIEKIMVGKLKKFYEEVCLINQKFIKQDKLSVEQHMQNVGKESGCTITVKQFKRFSIGK